MDMKNNDGWASLSIDELSLSTRARNILLGAGIKTIGGVAGKSDRELSRLPGMGEITLRECRHSVRSFLSENSVFFDAVHALRKAVWSAGGSGLSPVEATHVISILLAQKWELRRS